MRAERVTSRSKITYLPVKKSVPIKNRLVVGLIILLILYFALLFATQYWRLLQLRQTLVGIEEDILAVRIQNEEMLREIERLNTPAYLEEVAREELGMVRSSELLFLFQEGDNPPAD